jgi:hypothetical protein
MLPKRRAVGETRRSARRKIGGVPTPGVEPSPTPVDGAAPELSVARVEVEVSPPLSTLNDGVAGAGDVEPPPQDGAARRLHVVSSYSADSPRRSSLEESAPQGERRSVNEAKPAEHHPAKGSGAIELPLATLESATSPSVISPLSRVENGAPAKPNRNKQFESDYVVEKPGFDHVGLPEELSEKLGKVGYQCLPYLAVQISLLLNTPSTKIRSLLLEGPSGCGKSFMAKSLAQICGAELMCLSCYKGMPTANLIESPSTLAMANAMAGKGGADSNALMNLGVLSRAYLKSQEKPVILLIDELDKPDSAIDTFFLGPIQDARIWLESRPPIDANVGNLLLIFTKNFNRPLDEALLRRVHPIKMTYLDSTLERKILSPHCHPQLVANLVGIADRMRNSGGSYAFERPPAPEELLTAGHYVTRLLEWGMNDFAFVGKSIWAIISKSEHDRSVLEHMMRYHPDFMDPLVPDSRNAPIEAIHARLGRVILSSIIDDPDIARREAAWKEMENF